MHHTAAGHALTELILEVFRLNGRLLTAGETLTRPAGQTSARWQVLGAVDQEPWTVAEIGRRMGLTRQSVQRTADVLEADGIVMYAANPAHRRAKLVMLTARGRAVLDGITARQVRWANQIASHLGEDDLRSTTRTMRRVREALEFPSTDGDPASGRVRPAGRGYRKPRTQKRRRAR